MTQEDEEYSPYCEKRSGCGEDGCCSHIGCMMALVATNPDCKYGQTYLNDARENKSLVKLVYRLIDRSKKKEGYTIEDFRNDFDKFSERIYDKRYERNE
jgi:hypothetical protein